MRAGFVVKPGEEPVKKRRGAHRVYGVYSRAQVSPRPAPKRRQSPAQNLGDAAVPAALWTINRQAKRYRDRARCFFEDRDYKHATANRLRKESVYETKHRVLRLLLDEGRAVVVGYHLINGRGFELIACEGFVFHGPLCSAEMPPGAVAKLLTGEIEAKPKAARELRLRDAHRTLAIYIERRGARGGEQTKPKGITP